MKKSTIAVLGLFAAGCSAAAPPPMTPPPAASHAQAHMMMKQTAPVGTEGEDKKPEESAPVTIEEKTDEKGTVTEEKKPE